MDRKGNSILRTQFIKLCKFTTHHRTDDGINLYWHTNFIYLFAIFKGAADTPEKKLFCNVKEKKIDRNETITFFLGRRRRFSSSLNYIYPNNRATPLSIGCFLGVSQVLRLGSTTCGLNDILRSLYRA